MDQVPDSNAARSILADLVYWAKIGIDHRNTDYDPELEAILLSRLIERYEVNEATLAAAQNIADTSMDDIYSALGFLIGTAGNWQDEYSGCITVDKQEGAIVLAAINELGKRRAKSKRHREATLAARKDARKG